MAFTEFCCRSGGSNMNGGGLNSNAEPATTPVYSFTNGGWNSGTGVYTPTSGNPSSTVTVGDWASVFIDGATTPVFVGRVTAVNTTTVTISTTAKSGTAPTTAGTGISINVGGAWKGPNGTDGFPLTFVTGAMVGTATSARQRINMKNDQTYSVTANISVNGGPGNTPVTAQGYTTTFGDFGRAVIDGGTTGASYTVLVMNNNSQDFDLIDLIFDHNGSTGTADLASFNRGCGQVLRCTFRNGKGNGANNAFSTNGVQYSLCDAYGNGASGFTSGAGPCIYYRCVASRNGTTGFSSAGNGTSFIESIAAFNTTIGFSTDQIMSISHNCIAYGNTSDGFFFGWAGAAIYSNCASVLNGGYGFNGFAGSIVKSGAMNNCGTYNNTSGATNALQSIIVSGAVVYGSNPFVDGPNGDFRLASGTTKNNGFGAFNWTDPSSSGRANNVGFPDIGAMQHLDAGGSSGPVGQLKQFNRGNPY